LLQTRKKSKRKVRQYNKTKRPCDVGVWGKTKERGKKKKKKKTMKDNRCGPRLHHVKEKKKQIEEKRKETKIYLQWSCVQQ
jgi:hypothetical protein